MKKIYLIIVIAFLVNQVYSIEAEKLKYIGMPVGGICAGQVYLGGDGQLWNWDIFNISSLDPGYEGGWRYYVNPQAQEKQFENGFALKIQQGDKLFFRALNQNGFSKVRFEGEYPIGNVYYQDPVLPVSASLKAYSPFIPTDADNSGLPITVLEYTITNTSKSDVQVEITGWLQNMACFSGAKGNHSNYVEQGDNYTRLVCEGPEELKNELPDWGSMSLTLLEKGNASAIAYEQGGLPMYFGIKDSLKSQTELGEKLVGSVSGKIKLTKGESKTFTYLISWYFPNIHLWNQAHFWKNNENLRHYYSAKFDNAMEVSNYVIENQYLLEKTKKWNETWYDSSLPSWFLDRTFLNVSTLATNVCVRFNDLTDNPDNEGRFYAMEGLYLGHGTCTHVFHYEQAMGRVFPNLARQLREQVDLGSAHKDNGIIQYRGAEYAGMGHQDGRDYAIDGHAGTVMRIYREYTMSPDNTFLEDNWPKIKQSIQYMIDHDKEKTAKADGILEGIQYNTLDRIWYGKIAWISGLYAASLRAGAEMAKEMGDKKFAKKCNQIADLAYSNIAKELFNGEYFIQKLDPEYLEAPNSNNGCHTDQLLGQYWATQMGLDDIVPNEMVVSALQSIMKYNYVENYGKYLEEAEIPIKRWYADNDEQGIIMCTFPKGGADKAPGKINNEWEKLVVGYFSEVWTGQEHQLAATLISEGFVEDALKVEKAVHNRYSPERRNPYNEIEYGNHYTRAMSGYAPFVSAAGFIYNGPNGVIGFHPKMNPEKFKSAYIAADGWGTFSQTVKEGQQINSITNKNGKLNLSQVNLKSNLQGKIKSVVVSLNEEEIKSKYDINDQDLKIDFKTIKLKENDQLLITIK